MGRHAGDPSPWTLLTEAALAYADAESDEDVRKAADRLRLAAKRYAEAPRPVGRPRSLPLQEGSR